MNNGVTKGTVMIKRSHERRDTGEYVDISCNFLDLTPDSTDVTNITILISRGVDLTYEPQK